MTTAQTARIVVAWSGLPLYAATVLRSGIAGVDEPVQVIASRPTVPAAGMEARLGQSVAWIDDTEATSFASLGMDVPRLLFVNGWHDGRFRQLAAEVKRVGGRVVIMVDNSYRGDVRQLLGGIYFRAWLRKYYDHAWVPGVSAKRLMQTFGMPAERVTTGLYSADTEVFRSRRPLSSRPLQFAFVGQFIRRKNVSRIRDAFVTFRRGHAGEARLVMQGSGPLQTTIAPAEGLVVEAFGEPDTLATLLNESRALVLPSLIDHWPLVVHEAAACGCLLILSDAVGSIPEFATPTNARVVCASQTKELSAALAWAASLPADELDAGGRASEERAAAFSPARWGMIFRELCARYLPDRTGHPAGTCA